MAFNSCNRKAPSNRGDCVPDGASKFGQLWREMLEKAKVPGIDNGLRHSAISYALAANPEHGVALVSQAAAVARSTSESRL
jgi:hypothetical protein